MTTDLDAFLDGRDPYPPPWHAGPPPARTDGPVPAAYAATGALAVACPHCAAAPGDHCRHDTDHGGRPRRAPCPKRIHAALHAPDGPE